MVTKLFQFPLFFLAEPTNFRRFGNRPAMSLGEAWPLMEAAKSRRVRCRARCSAVAAVVEQKYVKNNDWTWLIHVDPKSQVKSNLKLKFGISKLQ